MPRYSVSVPVTVICTFVVEADDEEGAAANSGLEAYAESADGGISCRGDARISVPTSEQADWDRIDVVLVDE